MTTATETTPVTHDCSILHTGDTLTVFPVAFPHRVCQVDLLAYDRAVDALTSTERDVVLFLLSGPANIAHTVPLTVSEMKLLANVRDKTTPPPADTTSIPAPAAPEPVVPVEVTPPASSPVAPLTAGDFVRCVRARVNSQHGPVTVGTTWYVHVVREGNYGPYVNLSSEPNGVGTYRRYVPLDRVERIEVTTTIPAITAHAHATPSQFTPYVPTPPAPPAPAVVTPSVAPAPVADDDDNSDESSAPDFSNGHTVALDADNPVHQSAQTVATLTTQPGKRARRKRGEITGDLEELARIYRESASGYVWMNYDIPDALSSTQPDGSSAPLPNPAGFLRALGIAWHSGSTWIMRREVLDWPEFRAWYDKMQRYVEQGRVFQGRRVICDVVPYDPAASAVVRGLFRRSLEEKMAEAHTTLITSLANADKALAEAEAAVGPAKDAAEKKHVNETRAAINRAAEQVKGACMAALAFDDSEEVQTLIHAVRLAHNASAAAFNARKHAFRCKAIDTI